MMKELNKFPSSRNKSIRAWSFNQISFLSKKIAKKVNLSILKDTALCRSSPKRDVLTFPFKGSPQECQTEWRAWHCWLCQGAGLLRGRGRAPPKNRSEDQNHSLLICGNCSYSRLSKRGQKFVGMSFCLGALLWAMRGANENSAFSLLTHPLNSLLGNHN